MVKILVLKKKKRKLKLHLLSHPQGNFHRNTNFVWTTTRRDRSTEIIYFILGECGRNVFICTLPLIIMLFLILQAVLLLFQLVECLYINCRIICMSKTIEVPLLFTSTLFFNESTLNHLNVQLVMKANLPYQIKCIAWRSK